MTTPNPQNVVTDAVAATAEPNEGTPSGLRATIERLQNELKAERTANRQNAFAQLGLNEETGRGKAISKLYEGPSDVDAIRKFAQDEFGWDLTTPTEPGSTEPAVDPNLVAQAQNRVDATLATSIPATDGLPTDEERAAALEWKEEPTRDDIVQAIGLRIAKNLS